jgi:hypothetical protein
LLASLSCNPFQNFGYLIYRTFVPYVRPTQVKCTSQDVITRIVHFRILAIWSTELSSLRTTNTSKMDIPRGNCSHRYHVIFGHLVYRTFDPCVRPTQVKWTSQEVFPSSNLWAWTENNLFPLRCHISTGTGPKLVLV